jgi:hypothetical protein
VKSISFPLHQHVSIPSHICPWNMCNNSPTTGGTLRRMKPYTKQSVLYCCAYFKGRLSRAAKGPEYGFNALSTDNQKIGRENYK